MKNDQKPESRPAQAQPARRPARTNATRQRLFDASMILLGERGPSEVSVDEIAAAAGVSKGTVYYNFGSKSDLISQLLEYGMSMLQERMSDRLELEPLDSVKQIFTDTLEFFEQYPSFAQLLISELWRSPSEWHEVLAALRERLFIAGAESLRRLVVKHDGDADGEFQTLVGLVLGSVLVAALDRQVFHPERQTETVVQMLLTPLSGYLNVPVTEL